MWDRLLGCFGDALLRKFGAEPPEEWIAGLSMLSAAQHERGLRRLLFGWKGGPPNLPDFMRLCRSVADDIDEGPRPIALPAPDSFTGDVWDVAANKYLMGHIAKQLTADPRHYGTPGGIGRGNPSAEFIANVGALVAAKKLWAADMRDLAAHHTVPGEVPPEIQKAVWADYLGRVEQQIAQAQAA